MEAQWGMAPAAPPPPAYEPAADPMYAPAPELSYVEPYVPPVPAQNYGSDVSAYAPAEQAYGQPYVESAPAYSDPMQDPWMQMAYQPAEQMAPTYESIGVDPSVGQQFGWDQGYTPPTPESPFFQNPQFAESNAQFDATTDPANRNPASVLGGLWDFSNDALKAGQDVVSDTFQQAGNFMNPYGWNAPTASGYAGSRASENNIVGDIARFAAEANTPGSVPDLALLALSDPAFEAIGPAYRALRNPAVREGLDQIPFSAIAGAERRFPEMPGVAGDIAEITRKARGGAGIEDLTPDEFEKIQDLQKLVGDLRAQGKSAEANELQSALNKALGGKQAGDAIQASQDFASQQARELNAAKSAAAEDAAGLAARTPEQIAETVGTPGMAQIPDDVAAAIARGANGGKAATVADELGAVAEGPGEKALAATLKRAEKMPLNADTLLGVSELSDESKGIVAEYIRNTKALTAGQTQDVSRLRSVATKITGNIDNRVASEYARQEDALYREIINSEARIVDEINKAAGKVVTKGMDEADIAEMEALKLAHIESIYRKATEATQVLRQSLKESLDFKGQQILNDALKSYDAERIRAVQSFYKKLADAQQPLKEIVLGGDISTIFQQGLRGARVGGTSAITGGLGRTVNLVAKALGGEGDLFGVYMKNGLTPVQQMRADGVRMGAEAIDISRNRLPTPNEKGILSKIKPGWKAYQKWNDQQFKAVDKFKQMVYEGRLMQEKAMGRDITDPKIRRAIADFVNTAGSTSSRATAPMRGEADRAFFLTSAMTRAQINEGLQVAKAFTSRTEAANFLNQALSTAGVIGLAWQVQKQFGPDISLEDFVKQSFDPNNPKMFGKLLTSAGGKTYVNSFLPQSSLAATFVKTFSDLKEENYGKLAGDWAKFGFGRQNIGFTTAENLGGFGYGKDGEFFWGNMPNDQRVKEAIPAPLTAKALMDTRDPYLIAAQATGELAYAESGFSAADRASREAYGMPFSDLPPDAKAAINKQLQESGTQLSDEDLAAPYNYAVSSALKQRIRQMEKDPEAAAVEDKFLADLGLQDFKIEKYRTETKAEEAFVKLAMEEKSVSKRQAEAAWEDYKNMLQLDRLTNQMRTETLSTDPEVAKALIRMWENGETQYKPKAEVWKAAGMEAPK